ncbi:MAG: zinc ribbon domain-containing protein, partial [Candidatus Methanoperedens sp.]|nr:zinc ribbon domain-containing protein [Candidatus Methanoperedens sp.]
EAILTSSKECGSVTITARSGKQKATAQVEFTCSEAGLDVEISPPMIPADGKSTATVIIKIKDDKGSYLTSLIERTVELTTTSGTITSPVKIPQKTLAGIGVITSAQTSGTAKVIASCCPPKGGGKALYGEGKVVFGELAKRYCMHCGTMMTMEAQSCPSCGKIPPSGVDTKQCSTCGAVLPLSAKFCDKCGAKQPV